MQTISKKTIYKCKMISKDKCIQKRSKKKVTVSKKEKHNRWMNRWERWMRSRNRRT